jgi:hypothetical protein
VAFQAVKFYLTTHSEAFQERQHVHVEGGGDRAALVARIRESVYGIVVRKDEAGEGVSRVGGEGGGVDGSDGLCYLVLAVLWLTALVVPMSAARGRLWQREKKPRRAGSGGRPEQWPGQWPNPSNRYPLDAYDAPTKGIPPQTWP